jgi:hypothetical protein
MWWTERHTITLPGQSNFGSPIVRLTESGGIRPEVSQMSMPNEIIGARKIGK